jgi:hypothetical protein
VAAAVGVAAPEKLGPQSSDITAAMARAIQQALEEGIPPTNGKEIKRRMMEARDKALGKA